jgi:hypothetical protein
VTPSASINVLYNNQLDAPLQVEQRLVIPLLFACATVHVRKEESMETSNPTNETHSASESPRSTNKWLMWTIQVSTLVIVALIGYNLSATKGSLNDQISQLQGEIARMRADQDAKVRSVAADLETVSQNSGSTAQALEQSNKNAEKFKKDQEKAKVAMTQDLAKARTEAANGISQLQQDSDSKFGAVHGQLDAANENITRMNQDLTQQIARNSTELSELKKRGDRDYVEFTIHKNKKNEMQRIADVQLALTKTDPKRQKYDVVVLVDDHKMERKDRVANEPLQFLVGREQLRYELVVNFVDKDVIRGYVSTPKDKVAPAAVALKTTP